MFSIPVPIPPFKEIEKLYLPRVESYEMALQQIQRIMQELFESRGLKITIKHRVKSLQALYDKICRKMAGLPEGTRTIVPSDLLGLRVVCPFLSDIDTVETIIDAHFGVSEKERKGAELGFKEFGYESLHFLIECPEAVRERCGLHRQTLVEIQVRTLLQDAWAEVEHELIYKAEFTPLDEPMRRRLAALNANLNLSDIMFQEIRDYQADLHDQLRRRRYEFWNRVNSLEDSPLEVGATKDAERISGLQPRNKDQKLLEGLLAHNDGDYERAILIYSEILLQETRLALRSIIYLHRGMAYFSQDQLDEALKDFSCAVEEDPNNEKGYLYLGIINTLQGEYDEALNNLNETLARNRYSTDALLERAKLYFKMGKFSSCRSDCENVLDIVPGHKKALELRNKL